MPVILYGQVVPWARSLGRADWQVGGAVVRVLVGGHADVSAAAPAGALVATAADRLLGIAHVINPLTNFSAS
jgi:hypothetical protein